MFVLTNIILGAVGSILATVILYCCSVLYKPRYKEDFEFNLESARIATYQIQNQHVYPDDYALVIGQIDVLYQNIFNMYKNLYPMSMLFRRKEKRMIITLLNDIKRVCERSKFLTVGYSGENEKDARLKKIHRCFYKYSPLEEINESTVIIQLEIILCIIQGKNIKDSLKKVFGRLYVELPMSDLACDGFIEINSFRDDAKQGIARKCLSKEEFEKITRGNF